MFSTKNRGIRATKASTGIPLAGQLAESNSPLAMLKKSKRRWFKKLRISIGYFYSIKINEK
jgi:hypothetical protein